MAELKQLSPNTAYMVTIPRSVPAIASRIPKIPEETEEDYMLFLNWVSQSCPEPGVFCTLSKAPEDYIKLCMETNEWVQRIEESEYGVDARVIEAKTAMFLEAISQKGASGALMEIVKRKVAQIAVSEHVDGSSGVQFKDLVAAMKQVQEYERLEANLSTQNIAVQQTTVGLTDDELDSMTDGEVEQYRLMLLKAKEKSND